MESVEPALASLTDPARLAALVELAVGLDDAADLAAVARVGARGVSRLLGGRSVLVELADPTATTGHVSAAAGPEMSAALLATTLAGSSGELGEIVLDGGQDLGDDAALFDALVARLARAADRHARAALAAADREALMRVTSSLLQQRAGRCEGRAMRLRAIVSLLAHARGGVDAAWVERLVEIAPWVDLLELQVPDGLLVRGDDADTLHAAHAERGAAAAAFALGVGGPLAEAACEMIGAVRERWDGRGGPAGLAGEEIPLAARLVAVADEIERCGARRGVPGNFEAVRALAGRRLDPTLVELALARGDGLARVFEGLFEDERGERVRRNVA